MKGKSTIYVTIAEKGLRVNPRELYMSPWLWQIFESGKITGANLTDTSQYTFTVTNPNVDGVELRGPIKGLAYHISPINPKIKDTVLYIISHVSDNPIGSIGTTLPIPNVGISFTWFIGNFIDADGKGVNNISLNRDQQTSIVAESRSLFEEFNFNGMPISYDGKIDFDYKWVNDEWATYSIPVHVTDIGIFYRFLAEIIEYSANFIKFDDIHNIFPPSSTPTSINTYTIDNGPKVSDYTEARVKIQLSQELTLEREAFTAKTDLTNKLNSDLKDISISFNIKDENGISSNDKFFIQLPDLTNINSINGDGIIKSLSKSSIEWLMIPTNDSGGITESGRNYTVQLNISGTVNGVPFKANSDTVKITVKPQPKLDLTYYLPKEIVADQPFHLAVRVKNTGYGYARNLKIQSAQPRIIENNAHLLLNFSISNDLLVNFGNVPPGEERIKYWTLESNVPGKFSDFTANFTHSEILGGDRTSLIMGITTNWLEREIYVNGMDIPYLVDSNKDGKPDSILDLFTNRELKLYDSTILNINKDPANLTQQVLVSKLKDNWTSIEIPDIFNSDRTINRIYRSDGIIVNPKNYWIENNKIIIIDDPETVYIIKYDGSIEKYPLNISNVSVTNTLDGAVVKWDTDRVSNGLVKYGVYSGRYPSNVSSSEMVLSHSLALSGLTSNTLYYFVVNSTDATGNSNESSELTFRTLVPPDTVAPTIESIALFPRNTTSGSRINISVLASDNIGVTEVTANGSKLEYYNGLWNGSIKAATLTGSYSISVKANDSAGNIAQSSVSYRVLVPTGGLGVGISPMNTTAVAPVAMNYNVRIKSTENINDIIAVNVSLNGLSAGYQMPMSWFSWTEKKIELPAGSEKIIPLTLNIPAGTSGKKMFMVKANSTLWTSKAQGSAIITIS